MQVGKLNSACGKLKLYRLKIKYCVWEIEYYAGWKIK